MAIFGFKRRKDEKIEQAAESTKGSLKSVSVKSRPDKVVASKAAKSTIKAVANVPILSSAVASGMASVILRPRITEKSGILSQTGTYTFEIAKNANKDSVSKAVSAIYKVTPVRVSIINTPIKNVFVKGRKGTVAGVKKAIVTVKKGDKIEFV